MFILKRLSLGTILLAAASGILLLTDVRKAGTKRVAILQHASTPALDEGIDGMLDGLAEKGWVDGKNIDIKRFNAEGDVTLSNTIAREITNGSYDLLLTSSTVSLQAVANANRDGKTPHVFGLVADPYHAGVGIDSPTVHPKHLTGCGIFSPVKQAFVMARRLNPGLKRVGVALNPAESNSKAFVQEAEKVCKELNIELLQDAVNSTSGVHLAVSSLISKDAEAIWIQGDVTVMVAIDTIIDLAKKANIPVFTIVPGKPDRGSLFDMGVDFREAGRHSGLIAGDILNGADPAKIDARDVIDLVPHKLYVNKMALKGLKGAWRIPDDVVEQADIVVDETGTHEKKPAKK